MILHSKQSQYALRALSHIAALEPDKVCQATTISKKENIPKPFLSKILKQLVQKKILKSIKGPGGGFVLNKKPERITLYEIQAIFDDLDDEFNRCAIGWKRCSDAKPCGLHFEYKKVREAFKKHLRGNTLAVFVKARKVKEAGD